MALIPCSECGSDVSDKATACPKCGNPISTQAGTAAATTSSTPTPKPGMGTGMKAVLWVGGALVAFLLFGAIAGNQPGAKEKATDQMAIELCRKDEADELKSIATRKFIRSTCDAMERKFSDRYGHAP
ncbi:zinc-ribbon domain-containing protein [Cupriavidus nantongensis]